MALVTVDAKDKHVSLDNQMTYALVGTPNAGKTTLFNALTGLHQRVANYPGVTIDHKVGSFYSQHGKPITIIDLPGAYSLTPYSLDEAVMHDVFFGQIANVPQLDRIICVIDASHLDRNLYLAQQLAEWGRPTVLVLNMHDLALKQGLRIDTKKLEEELGMPVVLCQAAKGEGILSLKLALSRADIPRPQCQLALPMSIQAPLMPLVNELRHQYQFTESEAIGKAVHILVEGAGFQGNTEVEEAYALCRDHLDRECTQWRSLLIQSRYQRIKDIYQKVTTRKKPQKNASVTEHVDNVVLHPLLGWFSLVLIMGGLFWSLFSLATYPMQWMEYGIDQLQVFLNSVLMEGPIRGLLVDGIVKGVGNVLVFLPQILLLFLFIGLLESSGYMPRAAFMLDGLMSKVGLQGRSFIPLLSSYACAVPGIMATRTIASRQERFATIMIAPWMSCSSRLPVYLLLIAVLFPHAQVSSGLKAMMLLSIYCTGTVAAFIMAWCFRKTILKGGQRTGVMELPPYRMPCLKSTCIEVGRRGYLFVRRVGSVILGFSIILWFMAAYPRQADMTHSEQVKHSFAAQLGHVIEPVIKPLGYDWKLGVSLLSSFAAREVFVSSMAIMYDLDDLHTDHESIPTGMAMGCCGHESNTTSRLSKAMLAQTWPNGQPVFTPLTCLSLLAFYVFALQCMSTVAITLKETKSLSWTAFQFFYMTGFAYLAAWIIYQGGKFLGYV